MVYYRQLRQQNMNLNRSAGSTANWQRAARREPEGREAEAEAGMGDDRQDFESDDRQNDNDPPVLETWAGR